MPKCATCDQPLEWQVRDWVHANESAKVAFPHLPRPKVHSLPLHDAVERPTIYDTMVDFVTRQMERPDLASLIGENRRGHPVRPVEALSVEDTQRYIEAWLISHNAATVVQMHHELQMDMDDMMDERVKTMFDDPNFVIIGVIDWAAEPDRPHVKEGDK